MSLKIAVLPGDGIGTEIVAEAVRVLNVLELPLELETAPVGGAAYESHGHPLPESTLKLAQARGVVLLGCARGGLPVTEYAPRLVKKALVGTGGAAKEQVQAMLRVLLPGVTVAGADAADALAVAICHAHHKPR